MNVILSGTVGSTAYGLARAGSDVDTLGVFCASTLDVAGLDWHSDKESVVTHEPDVTYHEIGKYLRLALRCNPTILELMWLPDELYNVETETGTALRAIRSSFLYEDGIRNAYGGYAYAQAKRLASREDGSFSSDTRNRTQKHARHIRRLLVQGRQLLKTGTMSVKVENPEDYFAFDHMSTEEMLAVYEREAQLFNETKSILPEKPNRQAVAEFLRTVRKTYL
jgi:uncharacterized protein